MLTGVQLVFEIIKVNLTQISLMIVMIADTAFLMLQEILSYALAEREFLRYKTSLFLKKYVLKKTTQREVKKSCSGS